MMKIGILQADSVLPQFQPKFGDYPEMFRALLSKVDPTLEFQTYDVEHSGYPLSMDECDAYLITGSKKSVYDDEAWIHDLAQYVRDLHEARKKTIGICFGHQMVAHALGGRTLPADVGWGIGIHSSRIVREESWMSPPRSDFNLIVSHKDQVTEMPPDAVLLATSDFCPTSAFRLGNHILAFQGHPEFCKGYSKTLMDMREEILGEETYATGTASLESDVHEDVVAQWIVNFIAATDLNGTN